MAWNERGATDTIHTRKFVTIMHRSIPVGSRESHGLLSPTVLSSGRILRGPIQSPRIEFIIRLKLGKSMFRTATTLLRTPRGVHKAVFTTKGRPFSSPRLSRRPPHAFFRASNAKPQMQRARLSTEKKGTELEASYIKETLEGPEPTEWAVMTTAEKVKETSKTGLFLGIGAIVVTSGYFIVKELMPTKMSAHSIFNKAFDAVKEHPEVTMRLGNPLKAHGHDYGGRREGRRNVIDKDEFKDEKGNDVVRVKFDVEGPRGKGVIYAALSSNLSKGQFLYLIFEEVNSKQAFALIDNRHQMSEEDEQLKVANGIVNLGGVMYGSEQNDDCQRQKMELGEFFEKIKYYQCDKHGQDKEGDETCDKLQRRYPAWKFDDRIYVGVMKREQLMTLLKQEQHYAKMKKNKQ